MPPDLSEYTRASNGDGEAVRAIVVSEREVGSIEINVDSTLNWPSKFIATSGMIDPTTETFDPDTVTVFFAHKNNNFIEIDGYAPGYGDIGHHPNEIIVIKPTTPWADAMAAAIQSSVTTAVSQAMQGVFPIGSTYYSTTDSRDPSAILGFGTWTALEGVALGGVSDDVGSPFNVAPGTVIGENTHTLTSDEMPSHTHTQNSHRHQPQTTSQMFLAADGNIAVNQTGRNFPSSGGSSAFVYAAVGINISEYDYTNSVTATNNNTGGGGAHNNVQRTKVGYLWERTA